MSLHVGYQLNQHQQTRLAITPEMRQAIRILQLSTEELTKFIQEQKMENPMLETEDNTDREVEELEDWFHYVEKGERETGTLQLYRAETTWENTTSNQKSLMEHLEEQLRFIPLDESQRSICLALIGNLNEQGYLDIDSSVFCKQLKIEERKFEACLSIIQSLDPIGNGSRTLAEYLEIQLRHKSPLNEVAIEIAQHYLPEVANGSWKKIAKELGVNIQKIQHAVDVIKRCNPRPNSSYSTTPLSYLYPDVIIRQNNDRFEILFHEAATPRIQINTTYLRLMKNSYGEAVNHYLKNRYQSALWLMKGIEQRNQTIYRITETILHRQMDFFKNGASFLKPLTLKQVSEEIELHLSTVSRATQNKYMQTPHGLFPFRFFFQSGLSQELASHTVKNKLQKMIQQETKTSPLSDQKLANLLKEEGIPISRRTVTKYREKMGIPSSASRKQYATSR
jgi:RNA polymerase sigma-54 factor